MRDNSLHAAVRHLRALAADAQDAETSDHDLLQRFMDKHDETAFAVLMRRHSPMVREVCRRLLDQVFDVEDASQVVFLVLACKARSLRRRQSLAGWLYGIAYRTALRLRRDAARRKRREDRATVPVPDDPVREAIRRDLCTVLDAELSRLPEGLRAAVVLCYLEGCTRDEAARQLGQSLRTLDRQLRRGRDLLRLRLARRGITLSATLLALGLSQGLARGGVVRSAIPHSVSPEIIALMKGVLRDMLWTRMKFLLAWIAALIVVGTGLLVFRAVAQDAAAPGVPPPPAAAQGAAAAPEPDVYALILIEDEEARLLADGRRAASSERDPSVFRRTQAVLLRSQSILRTALKKEEVKRLEILKGKPNPERWLARHIETIFLDNTGVLRVSLDEGSPEEKAILINAIVDAYMDETVDALRRMEENRVAQLERALADSRDRLQQKRQSLRAFFVKGENASASLQRQSIREDLTQLRKELLRVRLKQAGTMARLKHRRSEGDKTAVARLEEENAVLTEQEKMLTKDIIALEERAIQHDRAEAEKQADSRSFQEEIASEERFQQELADRVRASQVELRAPLRVRVLQKVEAPGKRK